MKRRTRRRLPGREPKPVTVRGQLRRRNPDEEKTVADFVGRLPGNVFDLWVEAEEDLTQPGAGYYYRDLQRSGKTLWDDRQKAVPVFVPEHLVYSDHTGSAQERSNRRVFLEETQGVAGVWALTGGHGTAAVALALALADPTVLNLLERLEDYPVLDDDALLEAESEQQDDAWQSWVRDDYVRGLEKKFEDLGFDRDELGEEREGALRRLFERVAARVGQYWEDESGGASIRVERVVAATEETDLAEYELIGARTEPRAPEDVAAVIAEVEEAMFEGDDPTWRQALALWGVSGRVKVFPASAEMRELWPLLAQAIRRTIRLDRARGGLLTWAKERQANLLSALTATRGLGLALAGEVPVLVAWYDPSPYHVGWELPQLLDAAHLEVFPAAATVDPENVHPDDLRPLALVAKTTPRRRDVVDHSDRRGPADLPRVSPALFIALFTQRELVELHRLGQELRERPEA